MTASELYAISEGKKCEGKRECHWCGAACEEKWLHDEPPLIIGVRRAFTVARPNNPWICAGCWLWRRPRITVRFLDDTFRDCQSPSKHNWLITSTASKTFDHSHHSVLYHFLTTAPPRFTLALRTSGSGTDVALHTAIVNETKDLTVNTPLFFTLDNIKHQFTLYELDEALRREATGKEPGVRVLAKMFDGLVTKAADEPQPLKHAGHQDALPDARILGKRVGKK